MWKSACIIVCTLAFSPLATAEIYKCDKGKGETVYQNFPCSIDSIGSQATAPAPAEAAASPAPRLNDTTAVARAPTQVQTPAASGIAGGVPVVKNEDGKYEPRAGMTRRQVRRLSWGEPEDIQRTDEGEFVWTYSGNRVLRFDDKGRLTTVQK